MRRTVLLVLAAIILSACDSYIEEARVTPDGGIEFAAEGVVACRDDLQAAIWGDDDPCDRLDIAVRTGEFGTLPLGLDFDPNRVSVVGQGESDRRTIDARWSGEAEELITLLVSGGEITALDEFRTEAVFRTTDNAFQRLLESTDPEVIDQLRRSQWSPAQFRIRAPAVIQEHNADRIQGRIVVWNIDEETPDELRVVWSTEEQAFRWWWWVVGSVILFGVIFLIIALERPGRSRPPSEGPSEVGSD